MPDMFGNLTPQEVIAQAQQMQSQRFQRSAMSGNKALAAGQALAMMFGKPLQTTLDTRRARGAERERLVASGLSEDEAKAQAKSTIGRKLDSVRKAERLQEASSDVQAYMDSLPETMSGAQRMAHGKIFMANQMRGMGLSSEASQLTQQAMTELDAERMRLLQLQKLKNDVQMGGIDIEDAITARDTAHMSSFERMVFNRENMIAQRDSENISETGRARLERMIGELDAKIAKDSSLVGRTEQDLRGDPTLLRKMFVDISDNEALLSSISMAEDALGDLSNFETTFWANLTARGLGAMEQTFGRKPTESEAEFMQRVRDKQSIPTIIAADIRHALTGAQMSAFEIVYLEPFLPSPDDPVSVTLSKLNMIKRYTALDSETRMALYQQGLAPTGENIQAAVESTVSDETEAAAGDIESQFSELFPTTP